MRTLCCALVCGSVLALGHEARADATSPPVPSPPVRQAPMVDSLVGVWTSNADPAGAISIVAAGYRVLTVAAHTYDAVGFCGADGFVGMTREPAMHPAEDARFGVLRFHRVSDRRIDAEFSDALDRPPTRVEHWSLVSGFGRRGVATPPPAEDRDSLPRPGEYVFVDQLPEVISQVPPAYPERSRRKSIEGTVVLQALVGRDGTVRDVKVVKSIPGLDESAIDSVRQWRFKPALANGAPVAVWVAVPVRFSLH
jgi:TonB family protein